VLSFRSLKYSFGLKQNQGEVVNPAPTVIIGNVTADPELTFTSNGQGRLSFSVAANYVWYDQAGEKQEKVSYFNIVAWRYTAENAAKTLEKGVGVIVTGRLEQRTWDDKEGNKRSTVEVIADEIAINTRSIDGISRRQKQDGGAQSSSAPRRSKPAMPRRQPEMVGADGDSEPF
jgi:single-strand DNA-binding protein